MNRKFHKPRSLSAGLIGLLVALTPALIIGLAVYVAGSLWLSLILGIGAFGFGIDVLFFTTEDKNDDWSY